MRRLSEGRGRRGRRGRVARKNGCGTYTLGKRCTLALGVFDQILVSTMIDGGRRQSDVKVRATRTYLIWNNIEPAYTLI